MDSAHVPTYNPNLSSFDFIPAFIAVKLLTGDVYVNPVMTDTLTANGLFEILRLKLAVFIVAVRLLDGDRHDVEHVC